MASSSSSRPHQTLKIPSNDKIEQHNNLVEQDPSEIIIGQQEEKEEDEWLKLGLGLGISSRDTDTTSCNKNKIICQGSQPLLYSPPPPSSSSHEQVGLGLGLGFERGSLLGSTRDNNIEGIGLSTVEPSVSHHHRSRLLGWWSPSSSSGHCNYYYHHYNHDHSNNDNDGNTMNKLRPSSCQIETHHQVVGLPISVPYCDQSLHHHYQHYTHHNNHGLWFTLRSSTNRNGEALPQVGKAYIRVRDENMTVLMVKKYLVRKLGLSNETEIDISCMGQSLSQIQTLKEVRDSVWLPRLVESLNSRTLSLGDDSHDDDDDVMSLNHIMSLLYRKHCFSN